MKNWLTTHRRSLSIGIVLLLMLGLLAYVALRAGPLAPVAVRLQAVEQQAITPSLFGIGTVQARFTHKIGPVAAGRVKQVAVQPGDFVKAGQLLGEMDPVDLNERIGALDASRKRAEAADIIVVTHYEKIIPTFKRIYHIRDGVTHDEVGEGRGIE